jgi:hypothetical protein
VLFVGNSYTYYNNLPWIIQELSAKESQPLEFEMVSFPGCGLDVHWQNGSALNAIYQKKWDYVVLQEFSLRPIDDKASFFRFGSMFNEYIRRNGAKTLFYMTWARKATPEKQIILTNAYTSLAAELGAGVAPVGMAWENSLMTKPDLALHVEDGSHPRPEGSYLAACVFYATLYGKSAQNLPYKLQLRTPHGRYPFEIKAEDAAFLQKMADQAVEQLKIRRPVPASSSANGPMPNGPEEMRPIDPPNPPQQTP